MAATKGLIFLEAKSSILYEQLHPRILKDKREPCEITFSDFDDVSFKIAVSPDTLSIVQVHIAMKDLAQLRKMGADAILSKCFPGMEITPGENYQYAFQFDCDNLPTDKESFLTNVSELKRNLIAGPLDKAFTALLDKTSSNLPIMTLEYRKGEPMFICCGNNSKVVVVFQVNFTDVTDRAVARVFLQEFLEAQRTVRTSPSIGFSKEPLGELAGVEGINYNPNITAGFISFAVEERHLSGQGKEKAITLLAGFRNYLHYHIKSSKTYLHMRMRKRLAGWMLVLNRALPEVEGEKKTVAGKTFTRK
mmetsp:Transcript_7654/g.12932  ORF Transcript_7654/g.12932 Transcript_7654/m.12932 type:complete len:306 (-) Transcript_7654:2122-3039(-)